MGDETWARLWTRAVLCVFQGIILREAWVVRAKFMDVIQHAYCSWLFVARVADTRVEQRLTELRVKKTYAMIGWSKNLWLVVVSIFVCFGETYSSDTLFFTGFFSQRLVALVLIYFGYCLVLALPPTQLNIDRAFMLLSCVSLSRLIWECSQVEDDRLVIDAPLRITWRILLSVVYMRWHVSTIINLLHSLLACLAYSRFPALASTFQACVIFELVGWILTTFHCIIVESWFKELLWKDLVAHDAQQAKHRLLSGLCDAVVQLDPDLRIIAATPKLMHLLCPAYPVSPTELEHSSFNEILATQSDQDQFAAFISSALADASETLEGAARALRVNLHHRRGGEVSVELFHAFEGMDHNSWHLIGIREVRKVDHPPDDLQFDRNMPSTPLVIKQRISSQSSKSGSIASGSSCGKRKLLGLDKVRLQIGIDLRIKEYVLCLGDAEPNTPDARKPALRSCLVGKCAQPFIAQVQEVTNHLFSAGSEDCIELDLASPIFFRPPTSACASSKIILCAESARLALSLTDDTIDDDEVPFQPSMELELINVSQVTGYQLDKL